MTQSEVVLYQRGGWRLLLLPLSLLFQLLTAVRRTLQQGRAKPPEPRVPIVIVGNITLGGTGKTPLLIKLVQYLEAQGYKPGVVSRGYGANAKSFPVAVNADSSSEQCGDEPVVIARETGCPVVIDPDRNGALNLLLQNFDVDVVLSDDGLQHYRLYRDVEIAVVDGQRQFGNGMLLPVGPLREPVSRLRQVDYVVLNGAVPDENKHPALKDALVMEVQPQFLINQVSGDKLPFSGAPFHMGTKVKAVAGIGNPQRFFDAVEKLPYPVETFAFPDHHAFTPEDFSELGIDEHQPVVMTEKDAVKCQDFAGPNFWTLTIDVDLPEEFFQGISDKLTSISNES